MGRGRLGGFVGSLVFSACVVVAVAVVTTHRKHTRTLREEHDDPRAENHRGGAGTARSVVSLVARRATRGTRDRARLLAVSRPVVGTAVAALEVYVAAQDPIPVAEPDEASRFGGLTVVPDLPEESTPAPTECNSAQQVAAPQVEDSGLLPNRINSAAYEAYEFTSWCDDTGVLVVDVPTSWSDVQTDPVVDDDGVTYPQILAAPDADVFLKGYQTPGMSFAVDTSGGTTVDAWLARSDLSGDGATDGVDDYDDGLYRGKVQLWYDCGPSNAQVAVVAAQPHDEAFTMRVVVQALTDADLEAVEHIIRTFRVVTE